MLVATRKITALISADPGCALGHLRESACARLQPCRKKTMAVCYNAALLSAFELTCKIRTHDVYVTCAISALYASARIGLMSSTASDRC